jgi:hypothetical protein
MIRMTDSRTLLLLATAAALAACSGSGGSGDTTPVPANDARLSVSLMDAPVDDVVAVNVVITALWIKPVGGPAVELPLTESPLTVDLLATAPDHPALLVDNAAIDAGEYEWLAMDVDAEIDGTVTDSFVATGSGGEEELFVPSGRIRLVDGIDAESNAALALVFDWDLRRGLIHPPGLGGYLLKPAFRVIDQTAYGRISGSIALDSVMLDENHCANDDADYDVGNAVYVFAGLDVEPDDIDEEMDVEPLAVVSAELDDDSTAYTYGTLLPFGDYTVAFTCQAASDMPTSNDYGNENPDDDTLAFWSPAVSKTLSGDSPDTASAVIDF